MKAGNVLVILSTVALDAVGVGLVMPVLPGLLRDLVRSEDIAGHYGALLAAYALMQFLCAPALGALSDRYGRRPILLLSLAGAAIDYLVMATAPTLLVLYLGRLVAGITGATGAVAGACIADLADGRERARYFGLMSACFGLGMIAGPVIGGLMGGISPRMPFLGAAFLNGLNFLMACFLLPESRSGERRPLSLKALMPASSFLWARGKPVVIALMSVFFVMQFAGQVPGTLWVIFGEDRFRWDAATVGISLAAFGALHALVQALATGALTARLGEARTLLLGMAADALGYVLLAFATRGWMAFPIMILLASGGVGMPALQAMLSAQVDPQRQGRLQGALAGLSNLSSIVGPVAITALYASPPGWNGWPWIAGAVLYGLCLPALRRGTADEACRALGRPALLSRDHKPQGRE
ncbi:Tetracycline resistance protein, class C [Achromobacter insolitus]|jgi:DHA1 family tetracycline resistance protein-like MFS transporter|uniref:Tet(A)/Tet(B)/Tet(C) family tetracycline efflux MFS transporter n=1 Tax=Achromobacter insolitus TaxID=217204 RepID=UPI000DD1751B|nr:Tet(A)/Tet(B)/Tet(C) family tetracycline efflux MFS transporter [Achromobacter insolitus]AXA70376.1 tetracycline resistance MFS efflux pump [Achromobacter insolitus]CAB3958022.1 Tetracycline resistance protein, class C [Achromobacter insolitus]